MKLINADIYKFIEFANGKHVVCFGAGQVLHNFINEYSELRLEDVIEWIVDNSCEKKGTVYTYKEKKIPIIGIEELCQLENIIILITCRDVVSVYEQLNQYVVLSDVPCFVARYISSETNFLMESRRAYPTEYRLMQEALIPKKIHYCWFGRNPIPEKYQIWMESWKKYCPDYEIVEWNEDNYDISKNAYMKEAYQNKKWAFVSDYARLDIIYEHGGIYLDTDVELVKPIDELLYQQGFAGVDATKLISLGLGFGAIKGLPIIKLLKDVYEGRHFVAEDGTFDLTPIPRIQKELFQTLGYINNGEYQIVQDMTIYPEKVLAGMCPWTGRILVTENTFMIHHYEGSWLSDDIKRVDIQRKQLFDSAISTL